jgi:hypothetical protein
MPEPRYDVAISFLSADESVASAVWKGLSEGLSVFFYPRSQEELAGTDGLESMREPFLTENARVVVVFYRDRWGQTPWTGVEEVAIRDRCLTDKFQSLFFLMLDNTSVPPVWLPNTHVRFNYAEFGLEQAIGAIKARVKERGGAITPLTPLRRAELYQLEQEFLEDRRDFRSRNNHSVIGHQTSLLFDRIKTLCSEINSANDMGLQFFAENTGVSCHIRNYRVSVTVNLQWSNFDCELVVREFDRRLAVPALGEQPIYAGGQPREKRARRFTPELSRAREYGWIEEGQSASFITGDALADQILIDFVNLIETVDNTIPARPTVIPGHRRRRL